MQSGFKNAYDSIKELSATDFTQDLQGIGILISLCFTEMTTRG